MKVARLDSVAQLPVVTRPGEDSAYDLYVVEDVVLCCGQVALLRTGVAAAQDGCGFLIIGRSSAAVRGIVVVPSVIDAGYRGEWHVPVVYLGLQPTCCLRRGERVAQALPVPVTTRQVEEVMTVTGLGPAIRGNRGLGSSGR